METFQAIWKLSRQYGVFQIFWKLSRQFCNLPENLEAFYAFYNFQTTQKISRQNQNFPDNSETYKTIWKLSGRVKTFRGAMLLRYLRISVSATSVPSTTAYYSAQQQYIVCYGTFEIEARFIKL